MLSRKRFAILLASIGLVSIVNAQEQKKTGSERGSTPPSIAEASNSAVLHLQEYGFALDGNFTVDDLAKIPDSFWPAPVRYDHETNELVFKGMRSVAEEAPATKSVGRDRNAGSREEALKTVTYREERFEGRMEFSDSRVDENGKITLIGPDGYLEISVGVDGRVVVLVDPPKDNVFAFYPMRFLIDGLRLTGMNPDGSGTVAACTNPGDCGLCACDRGNCGGGCTNEKCEYAVTCAGGCGSCGYLCDPQWCE